MHDGIGGGSAGRCNSFHCGPVRRTAVYRLYDRSQRLLYVGIAHDTKRRWREHAGDKDWWNLVHWKTAMWHTSRLGAAIEEYCAMLNLFVRESHRYRPGAVVLMGIASSLLLHVANKLANRWVDGPQRGGR